MALTSEQKKFKTQAEEHRSEKKKPLSFQQIGKLSQWLVSAKEKIYIPPSRGSSRTGESASMMMMMIVIITVALVVVRADKLKLRNDN